jgi:hypothetical protein
MVTDHILIEDIHTAAKPGQIGKMLDTQKRLAHWSAYSCGVVRIPTLRQVWAEYADVRLSSARHVSQVYL